MTIHKPSMSPNQSALDQSSLKTFALWIVWSAVCVTVFIQLYHSSDIMSFIQQDQLHVTWVLVAVFGLGVLVSFVHVTLLTFEWFSSSRLQNRLIRHGLQGVKLERFRATSRLIESIQHIDHSGGKVDLSALSTVEFSSHMRMSRVVGLMGSLLITMGLVGTVLGLTMTLTGLNGALANISSDGMAMLLGIRSAMEGMGMAFYTTLLGSIMGGILLRVFAYITDNSIEALQDKMTRCCMVYAATNLHPSPQRDFQVLSQVIEGMEGRMKSLNQSLYESKAAMRDFAEEMQTLKASTKMSDDDDEIFKQIAVHRHYAKVLRYELSLQKQLANFKQRLLAAMGFQSTKHRSADSE